MLPIPASTHLEVRDVAGKGRGVFTTKSFEQGELVDKVPVIPFPADEWQYVEKTQLYNYCYGWGENKDCAAVALGFGSIYNHSYKPSIVYVKKFEENAIEFYALRHIEAGEELLINYNGSPDNMEPVWFDMATEATN